MTISPSNIPEAAVEAAARASWEESNSDPWIGSDTDDLRREDRMIYMDDARVMLEAAAPHLLGQAWVEGCEAGYSGWNNYKEISDIDNPYRSQP